MTTQSSDDLTVAIEKLAERVIYNAEYRRMRKTAFEIPEALKQLGGSAMHAFKSSPAISTGLLGAGLGGAYGLVSNYARPEEERRPLSSALSGALAGGALGAGAGLAGHQLHGYLKNRPATPAVPADAFEHGGKKYNLKPDASPQLLEQLQNLESRSPVTRGVGAVTDAIGGYAGNHPLLATMLAGDIGSHALGTAAEMTEAGRGGGAMRAHFNKALGTLKADGSAMSENTIKALKRWTESQTPSQFREATTLHTRTNTPFNIPVDSGKGPPKPYKVSPQALRDIGHAGTGSIRAGGIRSLLDLLPESYRPGNALTGTGYGNEGAAISGWLQKMRLGAGKADRVGQGVESLMRGAGSIQRPTSTLGRLGWRGALYGGVPALQWYLGQSGQESAARRQIEQLLQQNAVPAGN